MAKRLKPLAKRTLNKKLVANSLRTMVAYSPGIRMTFIWKEVLECKSTLIWRLSIKQIGTDYSQNDIDVRTKSIEGGWAKDK